MTQTFKFNRDLLKVAIITSIGFGVLGVMPLLFSPNFNRNRMPHHSPRHMMDRPPLSISSLILTVFFLILTLWLVNIFLYHRLGKLKWEEKKVHILRYVLSYLAAFVLVGIRMVVFKQGAFMPGFPGAGPKDFFPIVSAGIYNSLVIIALDLIILQQKKAKIELENTELKMNHILAQHQHLKHQLQPHFLFNSLNILKSLIKRHPKEAEEYLIRLSDFLRASVSSNNNHEASLTEELKVCVDYLEMQKVRFKNAFKYEITIPEDIREEYKLPIFALQLLAENAIKHNSFTIDDPLVLIISYNAPSTIVVQNNRTPKVNDEAASGVGLSNLSARYNVISGKEIKIESTEKAFIVEIPLLK